MRVMRPLPPDPYKEIKAQASELVVGEQLTGQVCPFCGGGDSGEASFSVKREAGIALYICHRASCSTEGSMRMPGGSQEVRTPTKRPRKLSIGPDMSCPVVKGLTPVQLALMEDKFGITEPEIKRIPWLWDQLQDRLWMPIKTPEKLHTGFTLRSFKEGVKNKSLQVVTNPDRIVADWFYRYTMDKTVVLVEDQISALKVARQFNVVALLGTHIQDALINEIRNKLGFNKVILVLDKDAMQKALSYQKKYRELFNHFIIKQPERDLKYLSNERIKEIIETP